MKTTAIGYGVLTAAICVATMGCMMAGTYHSAKTLDPGTSSVGLTFGVNQFSTSSGSITVPDLLPELTFHTGVAENMEVGGRIALGALGIEGDFKYRFLKTDKLHLAMDPSIGYQGFIVMKGVTFGLPIISTVDLTPHFGLNASLFGRYAHYSASDSTLGDAISNIIGDAFMVGGAFGPDIRGESFFIRPMIEYAHVIPAAGAVWSAWNRVSIAVHFGWIIGREKQQLDRIEKKIDGMDKKLDK
ncbi:MAG: hypothetical protein ABSF80_00215 [Chitinispirillaceae bacterium]